MADKTVSTEADSDTPSKTKAAPRKTVAGTVTPEEFEALRDLRFDLRVDTQGEVVAMAVREFIANHGTIAG